MNVMHQLKFEVDRKSLETIYLTFIRPILEYANVVWDNCTHYEKEELEKYKMRRQELLQALPNSCLHKLSTKKLVGTLLTQGEKENTHTQTYTIL